jgi:uncharacterized protein YbjT (DUF2867 family)
MMSMPETILVTGATGNTGAALLPLLEVRGATVRAMVRSTAGGAHLAATSAIPVVADFDDPESVAAALHGITRVYLVTPSSPTAEAQQIRFVEIAARSRVEQLVLLSQLGADEASPVRFLRYHAAVERRIRELGLGCTFLRPNLFMQGLFAFQRSIVEQSAFFAPIGKALVSLVDVRDIAAVAAAVLTEPGHLGRTYTLTGPQAITHADIATALSLALGRSIAFRDATPEAFAAALAETGMPPWQVDGLLEDYAHYRRGEAALVSPAVRDVTGAAPRDIDTFVRDYTSAFARAQPSRKLQRGNGGNIGERRT